jgi:tripartite-type tricarboxylate transporter receptor subunit TctC
MFSMNDALSRRSLLASAAALAVTRQAAAQANLPYKPIRILIGFPSSGGSDSLVHVIAGALQSQMSRTVTVDYKPGDSGIGAGEKLMSAPPDGSVIAFIPSSTLAARLTTPGFPFDPQVDLLPLTLAGTYPTAFCVSPKIDVGTFAAYVEWLKTGESGRARFGTTTTGSLTQHFGTMLGREIGVPLEPVPYRGARPLLADLDLGRIPAGAGGMTSFLPAHRAGRVKVLMISAAERLAAAPDVLTVAELGFPKLQQSNWYAFFAPPGMPASLVAAWTTELRAALQSREVSDQLEQLGFRVETSTPAELAARLAADVRIWKEMLDSPGPRKAK